MIKNRRVLAVIPARGGSKGVPKKNIRHLNGHPLIHWTIEASRRSIYIDRCIVSTDSQEIADVSRICGGDVPFLRPAEISCDDTPGIAPVLHALDELGDAYDLLVLLQPTSPMRSAADIDAAIELAWKHSAPCVTVTDTEENPFWMFQMDHGTLEPVVGWDRIPTQRQQTPPVFKLNGAVYVADKAFIREHRTFLSRQTRGYYMPPSRSLDIDTLDDFATAEVLMKGRIDHGT